MFFAAMHAEMMVRAKLIIPNNVHQTLDNIRDHNWLFYSGLLSYLIVLMCDLVVSVGMHIYLKRFDEKLSWIVASMRVIYTMIFSYAIIQLFVGFQLALHPKFEKQVTCMKYFEEFEMIFNGALILFGVYLIFAAWLCKKSNLIYKWVCILLAIAGLAYCVDNILKLSYSKEYYVEHYQSVTLPLVAIPAIFGEVGLAISLLRQ
ncbi:predicted protein [Naegleria gruberi]|uniref:Predicted protein n=1 Tax=Naegleria gruberi TaxID=5762 RepID=D2VLW0_NAEGR|nr:uncharacterized protein NAEGRDRAFT_69918 [Naegleria gruberi]EFC42125.1 predicted protein [Naegleria gruberi]|eukprot:XP_002674869.1 predicted protein [Naegleria gruberi strain NEG-M]